jgi:hypothetical protein
MNRGLFGTNFLGQIEALSKRLIEGPENIAGSSHSDGAPAEFRAEDSSTPGDYSVSKTTDPLNGFISSRRSY